MMPTFSDLELENREIPSLARTWQGWREAANRALSVSGDFFNNESKTALLDCFTILKRTYDDISLIIPCNEIQLYLEDELNFIRQLWWPIGHSMAPTKNMFLHILLCLLEKYALLLSLSGVYLNVKMMFVFMSEKEMV
jgi:hypothetical protein